MKVHLLYADRDLEPSPEPPADHADLVQDLGLGVLSGAMAGGDAVIADVVDTVVMNRLDDPRQIAYRQHVLADCLAQPAVVRKLYDLAVEALTREKRVWGFGLDRHPAGLLHRSTEALELLVGMLRRLRRVADEHAAAFRSEGFTTFFETLAKELDDDYFATVSEHLRRLRFRDGVQLSAELGAGNRGGNYVLRRPNDGQPGCPGCSAGTDGVSPSPSPTATRPAPGPWPSCASRASIWSPTRWPSPPTTSSASSPRSASNSASTSGA
jgi:hypothetical protein